MLRALILADAPQKPQRRLVVDVGGANVNGGYRDVFPDARFRYVAVDLAEGEGVDIVLDDPYKLPFEDGSVDVVISGQMLEHCEFFWQAHAEMMRVLAPDGVLFLIAPSAGPIHRYPVDCYRFYPDAYRALAKYSGCHLLDVWLDERGPWRRPGGCVRKTGIAAIQWRGAFDACLAPIDIPPARPKKRPRAAACSYLTTLAQLHDSPAPACTWKSACAMAGGLALARGTAIGVDPRPTCRCNCRRPRVCSRWPATISSAKSPQKR